MTSVALNSSEREASINQELQLMQCIEELKALGLQHIVHLYPPVSNNTKLNSGRPSVSGPKMFDAAQAGSAALSLMTVEEAAAALHETITLSAIRSAINSGALRGRKIGKRLYTTQDAIEEFISCPDTASRPASYGTRPTPNISSTTALRGIGRAAGKRASEMLRKRS